MKETFLPYCAHITGVSVCFIILRVLIVLLRVRSKKRYISRAKFPFAKIIIVLGSGGHTFEMFQLIKNITSKFKPRIYLMANTDNLSEQKARSFEKSSFNNCSEDFIIEKIPRSREVGQSWFTTIFTTLKAFIYSFILVLKHKPDCILCNGPGTCVPIAISAFLLHVFGIKHIKLVYVESICRVKTLSLTGKIIYQIADYFIIQWPQLKEKYKRSKYIGKLI